MNNIGENIKTVRRAKGMTQEGLASILGYTKSFLSHVESGNRTLSTADLEQVASTLGVSISNLQQNNVTVQFRSEDVSYSEQKKVEDSFLKYAREFKKGSA